MATSRLEEVPQGGAAGATPGIADDLNDDLNMGRAATEEAAPIAIPAKSRSAASARALSGLEQFRDHARRLAFHLQKRTQYLVENYPLQVAGAVAGIAFSFGFLIRMARSNSHE